MLTDQQIEAAARKLCELRRWEPESETVFTERAPHSPTYRVSSTHLKDCIREIRAADQVREAIDYAQKIAVIDWLGEKGHHASSVAGKLTATEPQIDASQSFNLCPDCLHEWRYHEIHQGYCVGGLSPACECRNKQPRI